MGELARNELDRRIVNRTLEAGPKSRAQFRKKWQEILDEMERFDPNLVIISAGPLSFIFPDLHHGIWDSS